MKKQMILVGLTTFVLGLACGWLAYAVLLQQTIDFHNTTQVIAWTAEEDLLANRAEREGDLVRAIAHQMNVVDYAKNGALVAPETPSLCIHSRSCGIATRSTRSWEVCPILGPA